MRYQRYLRVMGSKEELLDKIEEIGAIVAELRGRVFRYRITPNLYGLYVHRRRLSGGATQYTAGGRLIKKLVFIKDTDGTRTIKEYKPGDWELKIDETLSLCRVLDKDITEWSEEKFDAYMAEETFDPTLVAKVERDGEEHSDHLGEVWRAAGQTQRDNLAKLFRDELEQEWPTEFLEMLITLQSTMELVITSIKIAYAAGYMSCKGWITIEELAAYNLYLGDSLVAQIRSILKGAECRGTAFASAFVRVAAEGTKVALTSEE